MLPREAFGWLVTIGAIAFIWLSFSTWCRSQVLQSRQLCRQQLISQSALLSATVLIPGICEFGERKSVFAQCFSTLS